jgi:hypothetical protein
MLTNRDKNYFYNDYRDKNGLFLIHGNMVLIRTSDIFRLATIDTRRSDNFAAVKFVPCRFGNVTSYYHSSSIELIPKDYKKIVLLKLEGCDISEYERIIKS